MFDDINKLYFLIAVGSIAIFYLLYRKLRLKALAYYSEPGKQLRDLGYLMSSKENEVGELMPSSSDLNKPLTRIATEMNDNAYIQVIHGDLDDDNSDYRLRGYIASNGLIYKQFRRDSKPILIGYTARSNHPETPTIHGKRSWTSLWLDKELYAYEGDPQSNQGNYQQKRIGYACLSGISFRSNQPISMEAKACASALFYQKFGPKREQHNLYKEPIYGWNDTALLTSIVYSLLFLILYFVYTIVLNRPLLGNDFTAVFILGGCYYVLWAIIRQIKIDCIEKSKSFQPQLDMLNKGLSLGKFDSITVTLCSVGALYTYYYYDYDLLPLIFAIGYGVTKNGLTKAVRRPWNIVTNYDEERSFEYEEPLSNQPFSSLTPPKGEMTRVFDWDLDSTNNVKLHGNLSINFSTSEYTRMRNDNPYFSQRIEKPKQEYIKQMFRRIINDTRYSERVRYIASYIDNESQRANLDEMDRLQFALDFVQEPNIDYIPDKESKSIQFAPEYVRYPDETLYDQEGDSDCKAMLASNILFYLGYNIVYLWSEHKKHAAIAIELRSNHWIENYVNANISLKDSIVEVNHHQYIYCETTGDGFHIGELLNSMKIDDFNTRVELNRLEINEYNEIYEE